MRRGKIVKRQCNVRVRQAGVTESKIRIAIDALLKLLDSLFNSVWSALVPKIAASQVKFVGFEILSWFLIHTLFLFTEQTDFQCQGHVLRHFAAHRKDILHLAVVSVRPKMIAVRSLNELRGDAQFIAGP